MTGDNGILSKAQNAKERNDAAEKEETQKLLQAEANMNFEETEYNGVTIPAGMAPTKKEGESTVAEGLVAVDKNGNEWVWIEVPKSEMPADLTFTNETGYSEADQKNCDDITAALKKYAASYTEGKKGQGLNWTDEWYADKGVNDIVTENTAEANQKELKTGCGLTLNEYKETYQKMIKSVYKNGGFWIGRYEAGIRGTTGTEQENFDLARTAKENPIDTTQVIIQKDAIPYNFVTVSQAETLAKELSPDSSRTSSLLFGIQWDLVCKYLEVRGKVPQADINEDSESWGNYSNVDLVITSDNAKGYSYNDETWNKISGKKLSKDNNNKDDTLLSTGASETTKKLNIYDLAGNCWEWTLEHATMDTEIPCSNRGGCFGNGGSGVSVSWRNDDHTTDAFLSVLFRPALY